MIIYLIGAIISLALLLLAEYVENGSLNELSAENITYEHIGFCALAFVMSWFGVIFLTLAHIAWFLEHFDWQDKPFNRSNKNDNR